MLDDEDLEAVDPDDVRSYAEDVLNDMANEDAAQSHSNLWDQDMIDLEELGYDDQSAFKVAWFGDAVGVNGELTTTRGFATETGVNPEWAKDARVIMWADVAHKLFDWLKSNGYVVVDRLSGAWPGGSEAEIQLDFVAQRVRQQMTDELPEGMPRDEAERIIQELLEHGYGGRYAYWSSDSGEIETWAVPLENEED